MAPCLSRAGCSSEFVCAACGSHTRLPANLQCLSIRITSQGILPFRRWKRRKECTLFSKQEVKLDSLLPPKVSRFGTDPALHYQGSSSILLLPPIIPIYTTLNPGHHRAGRWVQLTVLQNSTIKPPENYFSLPHAPYQPCACLAVRGSRGLQGWAA